MQDLQRPYVFISYSHNDDIKDFVNLLEELNFNYSIDEKDFRLGENWSILMRRLINNNLCVGVLFLAGCNSVKSPQVLEEYKFTTDIEKKHCLIELKEFSILEYRKSIKRGSIFNKKIQNNCLLNVVDENEIFASFEKIKQNPAELCKNLEEWGLTQNGSQLKRSEYSSDLPYEKERLDMQQQGYNTVDTKYLQQVFNELDKDDIVVLDIGCSNGAADFARFANVDKVKKVIGIDKNQNDIESANASSKDYGDKFEFYTLDIEADNAFYNLKKILGNLGYKSIDLLYSTLTLHHLRQPEKVILKCFDLFDEKGKIYLRGSDDGSKLCYPDEKNLLRTIIDNYDKLNISDRSNGRKLYNLLYNCGYNNIKMYYETVDTCGKSRQDRDYMYKVGFQFRITQLNELKRLNPKEIKLLEKIDILLQQIEEFKGLLIQPSVWYSTTSYIAIASVN